jgi:PIN domain nuclease of toxin-antitoxin system
MSIWNSIGCRRASDALEKEMQVDFNELRVSAASTIRAAILKNFRHVSLRDAWLDWLDECIKEPEPRAIFDPPGRSETIHKLSS